MKNNDEYYLLAIKALEKNIDQESLGVFELAKKGHENGEVNSSYLLSKCYMVEIDTEEDLLKGKEIYLSIIEKLKENANLNNQYSLLALGEIFYNGIYCRKNYTKAVDYFTKAEQLGNELARDFLARCYFNGHGVKKNADTAVEYLEKGVKLKGRYSVNVLKYLFSNRKYTR